MLRCKASMSTQMDRIGWEMSTLAQVDTAKVEGEPERLNDTVRWETSIRAHREMVRVEDKCSGLNRHGQGGV